MKVKVFVTPKETVLDPQGAAVREAMQHLGFSAARDVRIGRYLEIELAENGDAAGAGDKAARALPRSSFQSGDRRLPAGNA